MQPQVLIGWRIIFAGFKLQLVGLKEGQKSGDIKGKVKIKLDDSPWYDNTTNTVNYANNAEFYLANNGKLYPATLLEILTHEIEHAVEMSDKKVQAKHHEADRIDDKLASVTQNLDKYLDKMGIKDEKTKDAYFDFLSTGQKSDLLDPKILSDPKYNALAREMLKISIQKVKVEHTSEDNACDKTNELTAFLG